MSDQAALRGGDCGLNFSALHEHLQGRGPPQDPENHSVCDAVLGPLAIAANVWLDALDEQGLAEVAAALLADQVRAFEMLGVGHRG